jgi:hypothetical protein
MTQEISPGSIAQAIMGTPLFEKTADQELSLKNRIGLEIANLQEATKVIVENHYHVPIDKPLTKTLLRKLIRARIREEK